MRGSWSAGMPLPVSRIVRSTVPAAGSGAMRIDHAAAVGHRLAGVGEQVQEHLLNLVAADERQRRGLDEQLDLHAVLAHLALEQHERFFDELRQIGRRAVGAAIAGHAEDAVGDLLGPLRGVEDLGEGLVAGGFVLVAEAELGVVDDRREDVVEFVRGGAGKLAEGGEALGAAQLVFEEFDLAFERDSAF